MLIGAVLTAIFGSTDAEPWSVKEKESVPIINNSYNINDDFVF